MPYVVVNGYQIPVKGTTDVEIPNYADAYQNIVDALLQNKSTGVDKEDIIIPQDATLYYTASGAAIADGDFKFEIESLTGDIVSYVRRSGVWEEYQRDNEDGVRIERTFTGKVSHDYNANTESDDGNTWTTSTNGNNRVAAQLVVLNVDNLNAGESCVGQAVVLDEAGSAQKYFRDRR
jgi:hypothetical protein|tara:strand:+ start:356 stop:889 length:534 start_codon:yes stop_codon:yes gene_type:complete